MTFPIAYRDDWGAVERMLLAVAERHTLKITEIGEPAIKELESRYAVVRSELKPRVYLKMTDNWIELAPRFLAEDHHVRTLKDAMSRDILAGLQKAGIGIASSTFEIVGLPALRLERIASVRSNGMTTNKSD